MQGEEVAVTSYNKGNSHETEGDEFSSEAWLCIGSEAPGDCGNPHPWRYTKRDWKGLGGQRAQTLPDFEHEDGLDDLQSWLPA